MLVEAGDSPVDAQNTRYSARLGRGMEPGQHEETPGQDEEFTNAAELRSRLRHVYWIGGGSGAGKSTIARRLADLNGWHLCATDDLMQEHAERTTPEEAPFLHRFIAMDMDERWVNRSPETMLETFHWFRGEGFGLIVEDLLRLPQSPHVIVEGFRQAAFQSRAIPGEGFVWKTSDPEKAGRNIAERDHLFTMRIEKEAEYLRLRTLQVDTTLSEDDLVEQVTMAFGI